MGRARRYQPDHLANKLKEIRTRLDLSQTQMAERLGNAQPTPRRGHIAEFETGKREPSLSVLLQYWNYAATEKYSKKGSWVGIGRQNNARLNA
jgi:DNA-binding XRE family transcriptional regulator